MASGSKSNRVWWLIGLSVLVFVLWAHPLTRAMMVPVVYLNTHIHEAWHAIAAVATGGRVALIEVYANGSGVTQTLGGIGIAISSAGYIGSAITGALMIAASRNEKTSTNALGALAIGMGICVLLWVRGDLVGVISGVLWTMVFAALALKLPKANAPAICAFFGLQLCLTSAHAILVLLEISRSTDQHSDAMNMQNATGIPAMAWATLWTLISAIGVFLGFKRALK
jgi:hypothetical protein